MFSVEFPHFRLSLSLQQFHFLSSMLSTYRVGRRHLQHLMSFGAPFRSIIGIFLQIQALFLPMLKTRSPFQLPNSVPCSLDLIMYVLHRGCTEHKL